MSLGAQASPKDRLPVRGGRTTPPRTLISLLLSCTALLSSCSGGGSGGGEGGGNALLLITADGATGPLWELIGGVPSVPPVCPAGVFVNARITFTFDGPVEETSVPGAIAFGSINIASAITSVPAQGTFTVQDDPAFPAGNHRRVVFAPALPGDPGSRCVAGVVPLQNYQISIPAAPGGGSVLVVGGAPIASGAATCFNTCGCPTGGGCASPFTDPVIGAPFVVDTTPATSAPAPPGVLPCDVANDTIQIRVNEPLDPSGIDPASVKVVNLATGAQVPGYVVFNQATSPDGPCRIDYVSTNVLPGGVAYQVLLGPGVKDFGGNPIQTSQSNPAALLYFQTAPVPLVPQPPLVESFDTANPGGVTGTATWSGNGLLQALDPITFTGTGADGAFNPPAAQTTIMDTAQLVNGQPRKGVWNFTSVNIPQTSTVRCIGPYQVHLRCTGSFTLNGTINANAAAGPSTSVNTYDQGPQSGFIPGGSGGLDCEANGGVGNAGGGAGGTGSGVTPPPGSPPTFQCTIRALNGENGFGPTIDGVSNTGVPSNAIYAGGQGGDSGCFPFAPGLDCNPGDLGGLGGAGGTAGRVGESGIPRNATPACDPNPNVVQPIAQPSPVSVAMVPPIATQSAGSGGGGGGDHLVNIGTPPNNDDRGAGAGGGGGGVRITCVGAYQQGQSGVAAGTITARGAQGNTAGPAAGGGGSGSGGEIWIQSFSTVTITPTSLIDVTGPIRLSPVVGAIGCSSQAAGGGGPGLVQLEAGAGTPPTVSFNLQPTPTATTGAVFSGLTLTPTFAGEGRSDFRFTASAPDYTGTTEVFTLGDIPGATVTIRYEGAFEAVSSTQQAPAYDPATVKFVATGGGPITAANLDELDGYPFIRFVVAFSVPTNPPAPANAVLPSVDSIAINFSAQQPCP